MKILDVSARIDRLVRVVVGVISGQRSRFVVARSGPTIEQLESDRVRKDIRVPCNICPIRVGHNPLSRAAWSRYLGFVIPLGTELKDIALLVPVLVRCNSWARQYRVGRGLWSLLLVIVVVSIVVANFILVGIIRDVHWSLVRNR